MPPLAAKIVPPSSAAIRSKPVPSATIDTPAPDAVADAIVSSVSNASAPVSSTTRDEPFPATRSDVARAEATRPLTYVASGSQEVTQTAPVERPLPPRTIPHVTPVTANVTPLPVIPPVVTGSTPIWRTVVPGTSVIAAAAPTALPSRWQQALPVAPLAPGMHSVAPVTIPSARVPADPSVATPLSTVTAETMVTPTPSPDRPTVTAPLAPLPPAPPPPLVVQAAPAALVFGAARFAAQLADDRDERVLAPGLAPLAAPATLERSIAVPATPQATLDMTREHWPASMIERIEMIRDAANEVDTRIRLIPDALGAIDVAVKAEGDTLHVRFQADQPQTRALLAEAAPRLAEAAEARGLRLGQTSVGGDAHPGGQPSQQQRPSLPAAPPRAPRSPVADAFAADDDTRLA